MEYHSNTQENSSHNQLHKKQLIYQLFCKKIYILPLFTDDYYIIFLQNILDVFIRIKYIKDKIQLKDSGH